MPSGIVHDLRQSLSTIEACLFCLRTILPPDPDIGEYLDRIEQQVFEASRVLSAARYSSGDQDSERTNPASASLT